MKRYLTALSIFFALVTTGCIGHEWSICDAGDNCILRYRYRDENGADIFAAHINSVNLTFFDENGRYVTQYASNEQALLDLQGIELYMEPGEYMVVAWGNTGKLYDNTHSTMDESVLETEDGNGGMQVYYAPYVEPITRSGNRSEQDISVYKITIPKKGIVKRDLDFTRAYRTINVYVKGYKHPVLGSDPELQVEISHLAYAYDFLLRVKPARKAHRSVTTLKDTPEGIVPGTSVNTPFQEIEGEINIDITTADGMPVCAPINMKDYLTGKGLSLEPLSLREISILVFFNDSGEVDVRLLDWKDKDVSPVW